MRGGGGGAGGMYVSLVPNPSLLRRTCRSVYAAEVTQKCFDQTITLTYYSPLKCLSFNTL